MEINGQVALVTGANRGLGKALAEALVAAGAKKVYAGARDPARVNIPGVQPIKLDVTKPADVAAAVAACGDAGIVINNAGVYSSGLAVGAGAQDLTRQMLDVNLFGLLNISEGFAPVLAKNGGGAMVNILSVLSWLTVEGSTAYSTSKAAAWAFTGGLRKQLAAQHTLVTAVHVGYMDTDMTAGLEVPKTSPVEVAAQILDALRNNRTEVLADDITRSVRQSLGTATPAYL